MLQLTSSGGSYPKETLPQFFITVSPYLPMTYAVAAFRDIISGNQIDVSRVFGLYGAAIPIIIAMTALFKWILSRNLVMIKQPRLALEKINNGLTQRYLSPLNRLRISTLRLSREARLSAQHGAKKIKAARLVLHQQVGERYSARRTSLVQKVSAWKRPQNRRE